METFELLRSLLAEKVKDNAEITPRTNLRELGIDSVDLVEILLNFEEKMNLTFEEMCIRDRACGFCSNSA